MQNSKFRINYLKANMKHFHIYILMKSYSEGIPTKIFIISIIFYRKIIENFCLPN